MNNVVNRKWCGTDISPGSMSFISDLNVSVGTTVMTRFSWDRVHFPAHPGGVGRVQFFGGCWTKVSAPCRLLAEGRCLPCIVAQQSKSASQRSPASWDSHCHLVWEGTSVTSTMFPSRVAVRPSHTEDGIPSSWREPLQVRHLEAGRMDACHPL